MTLNEHKDGPLLAACFSVEMLMHERGKSYTVSEFKAILSRAGFADFRAVATFGYYWLVSARKPGG